MFLENGVSFWNPGLAGFLEKLARNLEFNDCVKKNKKRKKNYIQCIYYSFIFE